MRLSVGLTFFDCHFFAIHVIRNGRQMYWLTILFSFPLQGSLSISG